MKSPPPNVADVPSAIVKVNVLPDSTNVEPFASVTLNIEPFRIANEPPLKKQ